MPPSLQAKPLPRVYLKAESDGTKARNSALLSHVSAPAAPIPLQRRRAVALGPDHLGWRSLLGPWLLCFHEMMHCNRKFLQHGPTHPVHRRALACEAQHISTVRMRCRHGVP